MTWLTFTKPTKRGGSGAGGQDCHAMLLLLCCRHFAETGNDFSLLPLCCESAYLLSSPPYPISSFAFLIHALMILLSSLSSYLSSSHLLCLPPCLHFASLASLPIIGTGLFTLAWETDACRQHLLPGQTQTGFWELFAFSFSALLLLPLLPKHAMCMPPSVLQDLTDLTGKQ